jgi:PPOX class probable F420-dependent enzyme
MSAPEIPPTHRDLLDASVATLATVGADGTPQLTEVWFLVEDGTIGISLNTTRQKTKNLRANPACTFFVLDLANPARYLEIRATAEITPDAGRRFATKVGAKYDTDLSVHDAPGDERVVVRIVPRRVNAVDMSA